MPLITSISGIRGTIGGVMRDSLNPVEIVQFTIAYGNVIKRRVLARRSKPVIVIGRDARISGEMVCSLVSGTLISLGIDVIDIGLATTPTTEMAVVDEKADGGIILTASHNPENWNALKLLNSRGEFLSRDVAEQIFSDAVKKSDDIQFAEVFDIGKITHKSDCVESHISAILALDAVDADAIRKADFKVGLDAINSVGALAIPPLLGALGVEKIVTINDSCDGRFAHNPEPLPEHLEEIGKVVRDNCLDVGFVVDPDVDRLAVIDENGDMFGEEYTLVAVSDYILGLKPGATVSNLSSSAALADVTRQYGENYYSSAVGELNVVEKMKEVGAVIGGEGNGGVIYPELHYGRDALVGIALFLSHLAKLKLKVSQLRAKYPEYKMLKVKKQLSEQELGELFEKIENKFREYNPITIDGIKIHFPTGWVHLRKSNTEPIIRIYAEARTIDEAQLLVDKILE